MKVNDEVEIAVFVRVLNVTATMSFGSPIFGPNSIDKGPTVAASKTSARQRYRPTILTESPP